MTKEYEEFLKEFKKLVEDRPELIKNTLSNIFTMRLIGNKTHGDLAEIGITEFITQFMENYECDHVGKDQFRKKGHEEDICINKKNTDIKIPVSLKAYGLGPLQLSTDKESLMYNELEKHRKLYGDKITEPQVIAGIFGSEAFSSLKEINVLPLIYKEKKKEEEGKQKRRKKKEADKNENECNIMVFDFNKMERNTKSILYVPAGTRYDQKKLNRVNASKRKHPIYVFLDSDGRYICEVRYGNEDANALQRGFWTNTINASDYFNSLTEWIRYEPNPSLVTLIRLALNTSSSEHASIITSIQASIDKIK